MIYAISVFGAASAVLAWLRPSMWSALAAGLLNAAAVWMILTALLSES
jgi:hypothetical protein